MRLYERYISLAEANEEAAALAEDISRKYAQVAQIKRDAAAVYKATAKSLPVEQAMQEVEA